MAVTHALERCVASPAIGQDDRTTLDVRRNESGERGAGRIGNHLETHPAGALPAHLDGAHNQRFAHELSSSLEASFGAADVDLIHLNLLLQSFAVGPYHRPPQLVEHGPGRLVGVQAELPLQLQCRETRCVRGDQVRRPEPEGERHSGSVQNRSSRDRGLIAAGLALPEPTPSQLERLGVLAPRAPVPLGPPTRREIGLAGCLVCEPSLELFQGPGEVGPTHRRTLPMVVFGVNPISTSWEMPLVRAQGYRKQRPLLRIEDHWRHPLKGRPRPKCNVANRCPEL